MTPEPPDERQTPLFFAEMCGAGLAARLLFAGASANIVGTTLNFVSLGKQVDSDAKP